MNLLERGWLGFTLNPSPLTLHSISEDENSQLSIDIGHGDGDGDGHGKMAYNAATQRRKI
jgi:hypothetical protein